MATQLTSLLKLAKEQMFSLLKLAEDQLSLRKKKKNHNKLTNLI